MNTSNNPRGIELIDMNDHHDHDYDHRRIGDSSSRSDDDQEKVLLNHNINKLESVLVEKSDLYQKKQNYISLCTSIDEEESHYSCEPAQQQTKCRVSSSSSGVSGKGKSDFLRPPREEEEEQAACKQKEVLQQQQQQQQHPNNRKSSSKRDVDVGGVRRIRSEASIDDYISFYGVTAVEMESLNKSDFELFSPDGAAAAAATAMGEDGSSGGGEEGKQVSMSNKVRRIRSEETSEDGVILQPATLTVESRRASAPVESCRRSRRGTCTKSQRSSIAGKQTQTTTTTTSTTGPPQQTFQRTRSKSLNDSSESKRSSRRRKSLNDSSESKRSSRRRRTPSGSRQHRSSLEQRRSQTQKSPPLPLQRTRSKSLSQLEEKNNKTKQKRQQIRSSTRSQRQPSIEQTRKESGSSSASQETLSTRNRSKSLTNLMELNSPTNNTRTTQESRIRRSTGSRRSLTNLVEQHSPTNTRTPRESRMRRSTGSQPRVFMEPKQQQHPTLGEGGGRGQAAALFQRTRSKSLTNLMELNSPTNTRTTRESRIRRSAGSRRSLTNLDSTTHTRTTRESRMRRSTGSQPPRAFMEPKQQQHPTLGEGGGRGQAAALFQRTRSKSLNDASESKRSRRRRRSLSRSQQQCSSIEQRQLQTQQQRLPPPPLLRTRSKSLSQLVENNNNNSKGRGRFHQVDLAAVVGSITMQQQRPPPPPLLRTRSKSLSQLEVNNNTNSPTRGRRISRRVGSTARHSNVVAEQIKGAIEESQLTNRRKNRAMASSWSSQCPVQQSDKPDQILSFDKWRANLQDALFTRKKETIIEPAS